MATLIYILLFLIKQYIIKYFSRPLEFMDAGPAADAGGRWLKACWPEYESGVAAFRPAGPASAPISRDNY
jgi:hypothetical protein